jgi:hypothetical protein
MKPCLEVCYVYPVSLEHDRFGINSEYWSLSSSCGINSELKRVASQMLIITNILAVTTTNETSMHPIIRGGTHYQST